MSLDEVHEYNLDGFYDQCLCMSAKPNIEVGHNSSESVTIPPSLLEQFNELGMPNPISKEELKGVIGYHSCMCANANFRNSMEVTDDAACQKSDNISNGT